MMYFGEFTIHVVLIKQHSNVGKELLYQHSNTCNNHTLVIGHLCFLGQSTCSLNCLQLLMDRTTNSMSSTLSTKPINLQPNDYTVVSMVTSCMLCATFYYTQISVVGSVC